MPAAPDDFTNTLLHKIQDQRTTPSGGWLSMGELHSLMGLNAMEGTRQITPRLNELAEAGMIEKRFNADSHRDEWRSRGVQPVMGREPLEAEQAAPGAAPAREDDAVREEHMARRLLNVLMTTGREEWFADGDLMHALDTEDLGTVWSGLNLLESAGLIQRRTDGRAIRLHLDLRRWA